ncbi:outer membrane protein [Fulvimarina sp. MAC3]|uniref:outer membrane protein n=1 Tax=Fulvimarina sp. MAC3 TaxID=3148887 RepID=UPI0031FE2E5F
MAKTMMKRLATAAAFGLLTSGAHAADNFFETPAMAPAQAYDWTGVYLGGHVGLGAAESDTSTFVPNIGTGNDINPIAAAFAEASGDNDFRDTDFVGGLHLGYNYQFGNIVAGAEADIDYAGHDQFYFTEVTFRRGVAVTTDRIEMDYVGTVRARLGMAIDRALVYGTGGFAYTDARVSRTVDSNASDPCPVLANGLVRCHSGATDFDYGYTLGGGVEYAFFDNLIGRMEYSYTDFGSESFTTTSVAYPNQTLDHNVEFDIQTVKFGLSYKFN